MHFNFLCCKDRKQCLLFPVMDCLTALLGKVERERNRIGSVFSLIMERKEDIIIYYFFSCRFLFHIHSLPFTCSTCLFYCDLVSLTFPFFFSYPCFFYLSQFSLSLFCSIFRMSFFIGFSIIKYSSSSFSVFMPSHFMRISSF